MGKLNEDGPVSGPDLTPEQREPIETGWYAYSGGAQSMIFHLRETGQWSAHFDNGTAADCAWGYIEQALGVWDLVRLDPRLLADADRQGAQRVIKAVEKVADWCAAEEQAVHRFIDTYEEGRRDAFDQAEQAIRAALAQAATPTDQP